MSVFASRRRIYRHPALDLRLSIVGVIVISLFAALFARLLFLQVIDGPRLAAAARANTIRTVYEEAPRGRILDRNGKVLAGNRETDVITVDRDAVKSDSTLLTRLASFLGVDESALRERMKDPKASIYRPVPVAVDVDKSLVAAFRERQGEFVGAQAETQVTRWYPNGSVAAHLLGYVAEVSDRELAAHKNEAYRAGDKIGRSGIEQAMEAALRGRAGVDKVEVDSVGRVVRVVSHVPPVSGHDVQLSVDEDLQRAAEEGLSQGLDAARSTDGAQGRRASAPAGSVVAIDPQDGSVLAMASYPSFDPGGFVNGIASDEYAKLSDPNGLLPLNNRAIQGQYAPGSTFKLVTAISALKANLINPNTTIVDTGTFTLGNRRYQNAQGRAYGLVNISRALTVSSDVFFYTLGSRFWDERKNLGDPMQSVAGDLGFGTKLGVQLAGEGAGRVPDPASRKKLHDQNPAAYPEGNWYGGDNVNLAIGQGDTLVTPLQLCDAYATFANGGTLYRPQLVSRVLDASGNALTTAKPEQIKRLDVPEAVYDPIRTGLVGAVKDPRGTAYSAFNGFDLDAFPVAGKTGTAQVNGKEDTALFAGYGPVDHPRIAVSVVLEEAGFGGTAAAPVGRRVMAAAAGQPLAPVKPGNGVD